LRGAPQNQNAGPKLSYSLQTQTCSRNVLISFPKAKDLRIGEEMSGRRAEEASPPEVREFMEARKPEEPPSARAMLSFGMAIPF
jgi:hypothetical protein